MGRRCYNKNSFEWKRAVCLTHFACISTRPIRASFVPKRAHHSGYSWRRQGHDDRGSKSPRRGRRHVQKCRRGQVPLHLCPSPLRHTLITTCRVLELVLYCTLPSIDLCGACPQDTSTLYSTTSLGKGQVNIVRTTSSVLYVLTDKATKRSCHT